MPNAPARGTLPPLSARSAAALATATTAPALRRPMPARRLLALSALPALALAAWLAGPPAHAQGAGKPPPYVSPAQALANAPEVPLPSNGPSKEELKALFKEVLRRDDLRADQVINSVSPKRQCLVMASLEVKDLKVTAAESNGQIALLELTPVLVFTRDLADIAKEQKCELPDYGYEANFGGKPRKGQPVKAGQAVQSMRMTAVRMNGQWRLMN